MATKMNRQRVARTISACTASASVLGAVALAQPDAEQAAKAFGIPRETAEIVVDGVLDEPVWDRAARVDDLHQVEPIEFGEPSQQTEIRLFYDDDTLYVAARLADTAADRITANVLRQGEDLNAEDRFALIIDPYLDRRSGYRFEVNPNGVRWDALYQNTSNLESNWEGIWQAAASRDAGGWIAELAIPFKTLSFNPNNSSWGINFERAIPRGGEIIGWVSRNRQLNPGVAGTVSGFASLQQGRGLDIVPSVTTIRTQTFGTSGGQDSELEPSLDVFYKITPSLNGALTINTDFSATEVDDRQVNLSRFSLFFPEKRDFFLQDADIFEFGRIGGQSGGRGTGGPNANRNFAAPNSAAQNARPFFSRRIGLSATGQPVDLDYGGKLSGRIGRWNVGALAIRQDEFQTIEARDIFVGRVAANVLEESAIGVIVTDGDPRSNLDSTLVGTDFRYRNSRLPGGRLLESHAWYQETDNEGVTGENRAYGVGISLPTAIGWRASYQQKVIEENFFPAVGFIDRVGVRDQQALFGYQHRTQGSDAWLRGIYEGVDYYRLTRLDTGTLDTEVINLRLSFDSNTNDRAFINYFFNHEILLDDFVIYRAPDTPRQVAVAAGDYRFENIRLGVFSGSQRRISLGGSYTFGDFYNGTTDQYNAQFNWRPSERFRFGVSYRVNEVDLPQDSFTVRLATVRAEVVFSSTLSWVNLIQYDNVSENIGFNSRLHWIPQAGREGFIVFNHNLVDADRNDSFHSANADMSVKFSYTFRF